MTALCGLYSRGPDRAAVAAGLNGMQRALWYADRSAEPVKWTPGRLGLVWRSGRSTARPEAAEPSGLVEHDGIVVVLAGQLHDREVLRRTLDVAFAPHAGPTDCELVARAWARWGRDCPRRLLGEYAFALWDQRARTLFCARDAAGVQPLYYALTPRLFAFASTMDAVLAAPGVSDALDEAAVVTHLTRGGSLPPAHTFFGAVRRLPPGHALAFEGDAPRLLRWWRPEDAEPVRFGGDDEYAEAFRERYARAVADRLRGPGRVGVHLSGGLDSSSVAVLAARELRRQGRPAPPAFTWLPPPPAGRPLTLAELEDYGVLEAVCRRENLPLVHRPLRDAAAFVALLQRDRLREGGGGAPMLEEPVQRLAAEQGVRVMLSGWGGDEGISFNGRGYYPGLLRAGRLGRLRREAAAIDRRPLGLVIGSALLPLVHPRAREVVRMLRRGEWFVPPRPFVHPALARRVKALPAHPCRETGVRAAQLMLLERGHLSGRMEGWAASGARHGLEYRYPLLDRRVIEFALGLPPEQYVRGRWGRWLMRYALQPLLPRSLCWRSTEENPVRAERDKGVFAEGRAAIRRELAARPTPPSRAAYVDMPRLMDVLRRDDLHVQPPKWARLWHALSFLDF